MHKIVIFMILITIPLFSPRLAYSVSKCVASDGSVSYVQGNCPDLGQSRDKVRIWDSDDKSFRPSTPEVQPALPQTRYQDQSSSKPNTKPEQRGPRHPCNSEITSVVQARLESKACAVLNGSHDSDNPACRTLSTGDWQYEVGMSVPRYKALIERCAATKAPYRQ